VLLASALLMSASFLPASVPVARADDPADLPELGAVVLDDPLTAVGALGPGRCPTGLVTSDFVREGFRIAITGRCTETSSAGSRVTSRGTSIGDGEVAVDVTVASGVERARVAVYARNQENGDGYYLALDPAAGRVELRKNAGETAVLLAERTDLDPIPLGAWTHLALRLEGDHLWGIVNDAPVLSTTDGAYGTGTIAIGALRLGNPDDEAPMNSVWRGLRMTALAAGDAARAPSYQPPAAAQPAPRPAPSSVPPTGAPPQAVDVVVEEEPGKPGLIPVGSCPTGRGSGSAVDEGLLMKVSGHCVEGGSFAEAGVGVPGLAILDGEIRFEFKVTNGYDRLYLGVVAREAPRTASGYAFVVQPGSGSAAISKAQSGAAAARLTSRSDLAPLIHRDDWNTVAIRLRGASLWLLLNDQPILSADDGAYDKGGVSFLIGRVGNPEDEDEVAMVVRNVRVSRIEGVPTDRSPTYSPPSPGGPATLHALAR
jgi:hypothetical protein